MTFYYYYFLFLLSLSLPFFPSDSIKIVRVLIEAQKSRPIIRDEKNGRKEKLDDIGFGAISLIARV